LILEVRFLAELSIFAGHFDSEKSRRCISWNYCGAIGLQIKYILIEILGRSFVLI